MKFSHRISIRIPDFEPHILGKLVLPAGKAVFNISYDNNTTQLATNQ